MGKLTKEENDKITEEVKCETIKIFEQAGFTDCNIAKELALIGFSDLKNHLTISEDGSMQMLPLEDMGDHSRAVKKVKEKTVITESKDGSVLYKTSEITYELHDKLDALGKVINVKGIQKPTKIDVNHSGSIMAAVASHLSNPQNAVKEDTTKVKKVKRRAT